MALPLGFTINDILLEPVIACRAADYLVVVVFVVWLLFDIIGQPAEQFEDLAGLHVS